MRPRPVIHQSRWPWPSMPFTERPIPETVFTTSTTLYPCDRGTGTPIGWHHFEAAPNGVIACTYCGKKPS